MVQGWFTWVGLCSVCHCAALALLRVCVYSITQVVRVCCMCALVGMYLSPPVCLKMSLVNIVQVLFLVDK